MGQKINPNSYRLGVSKGWPVRWFLKGGYAKYLEEDEQLKAVREKVKRAVDLSPNHVTFEDAKKQVNASMM